MSTRLLVLLLVVLAVPAQGTPVADWHAAPDAKLVVVLVDGLTRDVLYGKDLDGAPLMPRTQAWADSVVDYTDVLAAETHARRAREVLQAAIDGFDAAGVEWVRVTRDENSDPLAALMGLGERSGRQVLVLDLDWLEPRLRYDRKVLHRLDPTPWGGGTSDSAIEGLEKLRLTRARRLGTLASRPNPRDVKTNRDLRWVVEAAHASIDEELTALLEAATATGAAVILSATSSTGLGQREAVGLGIGAGLDVARVPVLWRAPGEAPRTDPEPRQWIALTPEWFEEGRDTDRFTWAAPPDGRTGWAAVHELRWTTERFTLLDTGSPARPPRLYDRLLDPDEWYDRAVEYPAIADSLRSALRASLYGKNPVLVFRAGDEPVDLVLSVATVGGRGSGENRVHLEPGQTSRIRLPFGAETVRLGSHQAVRIGGEEFLLTELVVHSPAWRALLRDPEPGPDLTIWME